MGVVGGYNVACHHMLADKGHATRFCKNIMGNRGDCFLFDLVFIKKLIKLVF